MKSILISCLFILCIVFPALSQKMKDKRVDIKYVSLPSEKLPSDYTTYSVQVYGTNMSIGGLSPATVAGSVKMDGFKRVGSSANEIGHLRISVNTGSMTNGRAEYKTQTTTSKNDKGVETKTTTYWYQMSCAAGTSYKITDPDGNILATGSNSHADLIKSRSYSSSAALRKDYSAIVSGIRRNFAKTVANSAIHVANQTLRNKYDFAYSVDDPQMYFIKKHVEEDAFEANLEKTMALFKTFSATTPSSEILAEMGPVLEFWKKYADKEPGTDKNLQEVYLATNSNLAIMSFYTDEFAKAEAYAKRVLAIDPKDKRTSKFLEQVEKFRNLMNLHGIYTTHFSRDLSKAIPPSTVKQIEEEKEQLAEDNNALSGYAVIAGDSIFGTFVREKDQTDFVFGSKGNTKFMIETETEITEQDLMAADVTGFMIGDRNFKKLSFSPCAKGKSAAALHILEEIYASDKVKLFKYYPAAGLLANEQSEYAFQKKTEPAPISLLDTKFLLWEKGLGEYFADCADLKSMCTSGAFKMVQEDLVRAARVYSEVCQ